jgi:2-hydroxy-3-oxopropionate reductase
MIDIGIGLGTMGRPMAGHLQAAGHRLFLHDVRPLHRSWSRPAVWSAIRQGSRREGGRRHHHGAGYAACRSGLFGQDGVAAGFEGADRRRHEFDPAAGHQGLPRRPRRSAPIISMRRFRGGEVGAKAASLTIMVGGPERAFNTMKPVFDKMGKNVTPSAAMATGRPPRSPTRSSWR